MSTSYTMVQQIQNLIDWVDTDAVHLDKSAVLDGVRVRVLVLAKNFIAYPHCNNFSLMPQPKE